eukprot:COSAG04_NODE_764_length_10501_cov_25.377812_3_plen_305_part_00
MLGDVGTVVDEHRPPELVPDEQLEVAQHGAGADAPADQDDAGELQGLDQVAQVLSVPGRAVAVPGLVRPPAAAHVHGDDPRTVAERGEAAIPPPQAAAAAVHEEDRRAAGGALLLGRAGLLVVQAHAVVGRDEHLRGVPVASAQQEGGKISGCWAAAPLAGADSACQGWGVHPVSVCGGKCHRETTEPASLPTRLSHAADLCSRPPAPCCPWRMRLAPRFSVSKGASSFFRAPQATGSFLPGQKFRFPLSIFFLRVSEASEKGPDQGAMQAAGLPLPAALRALRLFQPDGELESAFAAPARSSC